jgi:hypothetical protein
MAMTKCGLDTPVLNAPTKTPDVTLKVYPGSGKIGKGQNGNSGTIDGPAKGAMTVKKLQ